MDPNRAIPTRPSKSVSKLSKSVRKPVVRNLADRFDELLESRFLAQLFTPLSRPAKELPVRLERCVRNLDRDAEWRAYREDGRIFFAIARAHTVERLHESLEAIDVYFLDENASVYSAGVWDYDCKHGWWLDSVLDLSYDCENGWWLAGVAGAHGSGESTPGVLSDRLEPRLAGFSSTDRRVAGPSVKHRAKSRRTP